MFLRDKADGCREDSVMDCKAPRSLKEISLWIGGLLVIPRLDTRARVSMTLGNLVQ
jgi:hypothetical protein